MGPQYDHCPGLMAFKYPIKCCGFSKESNNRDCKNKVLLLMYPIRLGRDFETMAGNKKSKPQKAICN